MERRSPSSRSRSAGKNAPRRTRETKGVCVMNGGYRIPEEKVGSFMGKAAMNNQYGIQLFAAADGRRRPESPRTPSGRKMQCMGEQEVSCRPCSLLLEQRHFGLSTKMKCPRGAIPHAPAGGFSLCREWGCTARRRSIPPGPARRPPDPSGGVP